jgi:hypothetical protein
MSTFWAMAGTAAKRKAMATKERKEHKEKEGRGKFRTEGKAKD